MTRRRRVLTVVLDGLGIGAVAGANPPNLRSAHSLRNALAGTDWVRDYPFLNEAGLFAAAGMSGAEPVGIAAWGRTRQVSRYPESFSGHWEMSGYVPDFGFGLPNGLDDDMRKLVESACGTRTLGNYGAYPRIDSTSPELLEEHRRTGLPILLTQIEEEPISTIALYVCPEFVDPEPLFERLRHAAPSMRDAPVPGRLSGRTFDIVDGAAVSRASYAPEDRIDVQYFDLPSDTVIAAMKRVGLDTFATGKVGGLFNNGGFTYCQNEWGSAITRRNTLAGWSHLESGLLWANFNDLARPCGAHRDVPGWRRALGMYEQYLRELGALLSPGDVMIVTGDHGVDPTLTGEHTYEWTPLLVFGSTVDPVPLGDRRHVDLAATLAELFNVEFASCGESFRHVVKE